MGLPITLVRAENPNRKDAFLKAVPTSGVPADGMGGHHTVGRPLKNRVEEKPLFARRSMWDLPLGVNRKQVEAIWPWVRRDNDKCCVGYLGG
jgi:hypothetical protein